MRRRRVDLVVMHGEAACPVSLPARRRKSNPETGLLARFRAAKWQPLTDGRKGALRAWNPKLAAYQKSSGVYVLRDKATGAVVYVGESHTGRLYRTMLRHFHDSSGKFAAMSEWVHHAPGRLEVLVFETPANEALEAEQEAIQWYDPIVNKVGASEPDDVPF